MRSNAARIEVQYQLAMQRHDAAMRALLQFAVLAAVIFGIVFGMAASYEHQHAREPLPHVTHGGKVHEVFK